MGGCCRWPENSKEKEGEQQMLHISFHDADFSKDNRASCKLSGPEGSAPEKNQFCSV